MWIHPPLEIVPNKYTIPLSLFNKNYSKIKLLTLYTCVFIDLRLHSSQRGLEPQTGSQRRICDWLLLIFESTLKTFRKNRNVLTLFLTF